MHAGRAIDTLAFGGVGLGQEGGKAAHPFDALVP
jgi:hypothetical protein